MDEFRPEYIARPSIPLLATCACTFWIACAVAYGALEGASSLLALVAALVSFAVAVVLIALSLRTLKAPRDENLRSRQADTRHMHVVCALLGCALGVLCASSGAYGIKASAAALTQDEQLWSFELEQDTSTNSHGSSAIAQAANGQGQSLRVRVMFSDDVRLQRGSTFSQQLALKTPSASSSSFCWQHGVAAVAYADAPADVSCSSAFAPIMQLRTHAIEAFERYGGEHAGVLQALACGYRETLSKSGSYEVYQTVGLAHIVAVSGAHLAVVSALLSWILGAAGAPFAVRLAVTGLFALAYVVFAGAPLSAARAAFMVLLSLGAAGFKRRSSALNALALCVLVFIALDPSVALSASFFLSAVSTLGILLFARLASAWIGPLPQRLRKPLAEPLALTLAANIATLPFSAALFAQLPLIAPVANILVTPLFSIGCVAGLAAAIFACAAPTAAPVAVSLAGIAALPLETVAEALSLVPHACIAVDVSVVPMLAFSALLCAVLWHFWPTPSPARMRKAAAAGMGVTVLFILAACSPSFIAADEIVMFDVGQGDAFLVRSAGQTLLIDTGNQDAKLRRALGRNGVFSLNGVVLSHADDDHCGSLDVLASVARPQAVYLAADALTCPCASCANLRESAADTAGYSGVISLNQGDTLVVGNFELAVIAPDVFKEEGGNADSLCLLARLDVDRDGKVDWTTLFCGDAEAAKLKELVASGRLGDVDVLKVGHHGSRVSLDDDVLATMTPSVALISAGANNRYGHPAPETLERLAQAQANVYRTDQEGDVHVRFTQESITVSTQR